MGLRRKPVLLTGPIFRKSLRVLKRANLHLVCSTDRNRAGFWQNVVELFELEYRLMLNHTVKMCPFYEQVHKFLSVS